MQILNVDDDSDDREFFCDAIKVVDPEISCVLFENGEDLLSYLQEIKTLPDYIFIDINMPMMNGYECAEEITSNYLAGETQIVMYSTAFNPIDREKFEKQGFRYVVKQNTLGALVKSIKGVMSKGVISYAI